MAKLTLLTTLSDGKRRCFPCVFHVLWTTTPVFYITSSYVILCLHTGPPFYQLLTELLSPRGGQNESGGISVSSKKSTKDNEKLPKS